VWLLITPIFFVLGWVAGRIDMRAVVKQAKTMPKRLFESIDAFVENKNNQASTIIGHIVEQEPHLVELQIILGKLYRKLGQNDLAINCHNKLLNSLQTNEIQKEIILLELAKDFHNGGLCDRAEDLLLKLNTSQLYSEQAEKLLLNIYQQDKNWTEAIVIANKLATADYSYHTEMAQFNCEIAQEALIKSDIQSALLAINNALAINRKCVRANLLLSDLYLLQNDYQQAITCLQTIEKQNSVYLSMAMDKMFVIYAQLNKLKEFLTLIQGYSKLYDDLYLSDFLYQKLISTDNISLAIEYLRHSLREKPSLQSTTLLLDTYLRGNVLNSPEIYADFEMMQKLLQGYITQKSNFKCTSCNFKGKTFFWQCPACYEWESINPNYVE
jgi:lipopolysaccharide biosynthesis regulator YciM